MSYSIGQFSEMTNISIYTLRYYEKENLIKPNRQYNGRRYYVEQDIAWVGFIKRLKETGMPIKEIREYAQLRAQGDKTMPDRMHMLIEHHEYLKKEITKQQEHLHNLEHKIDIYKNAIQQKILLKIGT